MTSSGKAIPIVYQGQQFPTRAALARHLAPLVGKTRSTLITQLSRYDGDVERAVAPGRRPITFEGRVFPHRKALAEYLAPRLHRPVRSVEWLLFSHNDDVAAVLLASPYRQRPRRVFATKLAGTISLRNSKRAEDLRLQHLQTAIPPTATSADIKESTPPEPAP
jgi:hypothetical protein